MDKTVDNVPERPAPLAPSVPAAPESLDGAPPAILKPPESPAPSDSETPRAGASPYESFLHNLEEPLPQPRDARPAQTLAEREELEELEESLGENDPASEKPRDGRDSPALEPSDAEKPRDEASPYESFLKSLEETPLQPQNMDPAQAREEWIGESDPESEKPRDEYEPPLDAPTYTPKAIDINEIIDVFREYYPEASRESHELIRKAYTMAALVHRGAFRLSGEAYLSHPLAVAHILAHMKLDAVSVAAGLLHDTVEDTDTTLEDIEENFGEEFGPQVAIVVDGVTKIGKTNFSSNTERKAAYLSKMVLASMKDLRVMLVKLADRLHNMRTLSFMEPQKRLEIAQETLDYYAPFATRLGIHKIKAELEDLSLFYLHRKDYMDIARKLALGQTARDEYVERVKKILLQRLSEFGVEADVAGRNKHIYSIWRKMRTQKIPFEQIYDLFAFRVIVSSVANCYNVFGVFHTIFAPLPGRFKDYIALPKPNGYRSLHTAVVGPENFPIEIQIRTWEMHSYSEDGVAAHWRYKVGSDYSKEEQELIQKFRKTLSLAWSAEKSKPEEYLSDLKEFLDNKDLIYVFTPKGDIIKLPVGSTPIDFAYQIHTDVGNHCAGAYVDGRIVNLFHRLESGGTVRVLTNKFARPHADWLQKVVSAKAKNRVRAALEKERALMDPAPAAAPAPKPAPPRPASRARERSRDNPAILVRGMEDVVARLAKCCGPIPGEPIVGYLTKLSGVTVHSQDCPTLEGLDPERKIEVSWDLGREKNFNADVLIRIAHSGQSAGIPHVINAISTSKAPIMEFKSSEREGVIDVRLAVANYEQYLAVKNSLFRLKGIVKSCERLSPVSGGPYFEEPEA
ncbi:MAG: RelA/SpoT family protein [Deltaproteobacteria bacterium]|jgi:GTP pyrophosphokinase|nr:RelA/SpoT family protein [Deltaproteobacteria bacterium]